MIISKNHIPSLLLLLFTVSACGPSDDSSHGRPAAPAHQVEVVTATIKPVSHQQTVSGTLEAITSVRLYNEESGRITQLPYHEGDLVNKGDVVITLDGALIQAELDKAIAEHRQAKADLKRIKKLVERKLASDEVRAHAQTTLNVASAEEKLQRTRFLRTTIKAPFSGVITQRNNESGDVVAQHSHILSLIDPTYLRIKIQLSESWLSLIDQDGLVEITINALGNAVHKGNITRIHPTIDPNTRKGIVEVELKPLPTGAKAGQLARVKIKSTPVERLLVPSYAVRHDSRSAYVFVVNEDNKAIKTYVMKGLQFGNEMEITEGLVANQNIIIKGFTALRDGKPVEIVTQNNNTL
jgi:membrane fusion protein (multidrug efflux system)